MNFKKAIDFLVFVCYNIRAVRERVQPKKILKKVKKVLDK